ncbi:MAG: sulfite exporter TauE/SafE family protein [Sphingobacteriales bacterium]|nr:MAG: sulfite exporter TauE/SafE family protein [Sphingobacteriales bacterium]
MQIILILLLVGLAAGMLSGLVGVGGGIIIVPCLVYFLGFSQKMAQGTSLGMLMLPVGILGVMQFYKSGYIDVKVILVIGAAFIAGSYFGSKWALSLPQDTVKKIFAVVMLIISLKMLFIDKKQPEVLKENTAAGTNQNKLPGSSG